MSSDENNLPNFVSQIPDGEDRYRLICETCGFINYVNPKIVVGSVVQFEDRYLLCKRAIEPRRGFWTLPAGFLEEGERLEEGALREAYEEACIRPKIGNLLAIYSIPHISQVHVFFRAELDSPECSPGVESKAVALYDWDEIPWDEVAFPSVIWALEQAREVKDLDVFPTFTAPPDMT